MENNYNPALELDLITISGKNPRQSFDQEKLQELANSISEVGVLQPITVRLLPGNVLELVFGERRYRASKMAGKTTIPAIIRHNMSDDQALEAMLIENLDRHDVHPLEEAYTFQLMLDSGRYQISDIAAKISKNEQFVSQRLSFNTLQEEIKQDFYHGDLSIGHAAIIARLEPDAQQEIYTGYKDTQVSGYGTVADLKKEIQKTALDLTQACFNLDKEYKCAAACTHCPKRSINAPVLFAELQGDNCLDKTCHRNKQTEHAFALMGEVVATGAITHFGVYFNEKVPPDVAEFAKKHKRPVLKLFTDFYADQRPNMEPAELLYVAGPARGRIITAWFPKAKQTPDAPAAGTSLTGTAGQVERLKAQALKDIDLDNQKILAGIKLKIEEQIKLHHEAGTVPNLESDTFFHSMTLFLALDTYSIFKISQEYPQYGLKKEYKRLQDLIDDIRALTSAQLYHLILLACYAKTKTAIELNSIWGKILQELAFQAGINISEITGPIQEAADARMEATQKAIEKLENKG